jgi:hypothetical protein
VTRAPDDDDEPDAPMRRRWRARFAAVLQSLARDEDADALALLRAALRRRRGPSDVDAIVRWAISTHTEGPPIPHGERSLVDDLVVACVLAFPAETTTALAAALQPTGPPWIVALLGDSAHPDTGRLLTTGVDPGALDERGLVVFIDALHSLARKDDAVARAYLAALDEAPLPRKAKGALRSARFRLAAR